MSKRGTFYLTLNMILKATFENIKYAAKQIRSGEVVAFPTETVYGLGADGLNPTAVAKIFEAKKRPSFNPLILHISSLNQFRDLVEVSNPKIEKLVKAFWPGPLTIVATKKDVVPELVSADNPTVAIRMPNHPVAMELIKESRRPIAAPSANRFGFLSPTTAEHVEKQLGGNVGIILDGGKCKIGLESTIVEISKDNIFLLRHGGIESKEIEKICGKLDIKEISQKSPNAPGQLLHHYAPTVPIKFLEELSILEAKNKKLAGLFFKENKTSLKFEKVEVLSPSGNLQEAAANLFRHLHTLESLDVGLIIVESIKKTGLGVAIMDRLEKATNRYR